MKKKNAKNLSQALNDDEFKKDSALASGDTQDENAEFDEFSQEEQQEEQREKPILTEGEIKVKKARKTKFAVAAFVLLLGIGVMGNWYYENSDFSAKIKPSITSSDTKTLGEAEYVDASAQGQTESAYFSQARVDRQKARDEATEKLQAVIDKSDADSEAKKTASRKLSEISSNIEKENKIETLVAAKGVDNVLAVMSEDGKRVDVIVDARELNDRLIVQVKDIAMRETGCPFENVSIIQSSKETNAAGNTVETQSEKADETTNGKDKADESAPQTTAQSIEQSGE